MEGIAKLVTDSHASLARSVAEGFGGVDKRFESMDKQLGELGTKFDGLRQQVEGTNNRIDKLVDDKVSWTDHKRLSDRVSRLEIAARAKN